MKYFFKSDEFGYDLRLNRRGFELLMKTDFPKKWIKERHDVHPDFKYDFSFCPDEDQDAFNSNKDLIKLLMDEGGKILSSHLAASEIVIVDVPEGYRVSKKGMMSCNMKIGDITTPALVGVRKEWEVCRIKRDDS